MTSINEIYMKFVSDIIIYGRETYKDSNHHILEKLGNHFIIDDPLSLKYPQKYLHFTPELLLKNIKDGEYDIPNCPIKSDALYEYVKTASDPDDQGFVYTYPNRIFEHFDINQFETMKNRLLKAIGSNRAVAVTIDPKLDYDRTDIPCLQFIQFLIRGDALTLHCLFRSNDIYGAFYSNMYFLTYYGLLMKEELNKKLLRNKINFGGIHYHSTSAHIYYNDLKSAKKLVK